MAHHHYKGSQCKLCLTILALDQITDKLASLGPRRYALGRNRLSFEGSSVWDSFAKKSFGWIHMEQIREQIWYLFLSLLHFAAATLVALGIKSTPCGATWCVVTRADPWTLITLWDCVHLTSLVLFRCGSISCMFVSRWKLIFGKKRVVARTLGIMESVDSDSHRCSENILFVWFKHHIAER